jgi:hypothetical protein
MGWPPWACRARKALPGVPREGTLGGDFSGGGTVRGDRSTSHGSMKQEGVRGRKFHGFRNGDAGEHCPQGHVAVCRRDKTRWCHPRLILWPLNPAGPEATWNAWTTASGQIDPNMGPGLFCRRIIRSPSREMFGPKSFSRSRFWEIGMDFRGRRFACTGRRGSHGT